MSTRKGIHSFKTSDSRWFKTAPNYAQPELKTDAENGLIRDVSVCTAGEAKGHGVMLEQSFIDDIVRLGNEWEQGLKCRFGHPNMSSEALGTYVGRFTNFRVSGQKAIADLQLDEVAKSAPGGDLYSYVLAMAQRNPDMFGASIQFIAKYNYFYDEKGQKTIGYNPEDGPTYVAIDQLMATDIVDEPAANEGGLFSSRQFNTHLFASRATQFLDENPDIWRFMDEHPEKFKPFLSKYAAYKQRQSKIHMAKKTHKPKSFFAQLAAALTSGHSSESFATTDAKTTGGNNIRIVSEGEEPAVGDDVYVVAEDGSESVAPDGDHTITEGNYDGWVLTVTDGKITSIAKPDAAAEPPANTPVDASAQQASAEQTAKLKAENEELKRQLKAKSDELERFKKEPLETHTDVIPGDDGAGSQKAKNEDQFWNQPWNVKHRRTA